MNLETNQFVVKDLRAALCHMILWIGVFVVYTFVLSLQSPLSRSLKIAAANVPLYVVAYYVMRYVQIPRFAQRKKTILFVISIIISSIFLFGVYALIWYCGYGKSLGHIPHRNGFNFVDFILLVLRFYSPTFVLLTLEFRQQKILNERRIRLLEKERIANELKFLKAQINPHFLFNTLNNLYSYVVTQSPKSQDMITRLSSILDYLFNTSQNKTVNLLEEVNAIEHFIELEQIRYGDRLTVEFVVEGELNVPVSPLILLSLIENAFKHGASGDIDEPKINIRISADQQLIQCHVRNTKSAYQGELNDAYKVGIGLSNIKRQLNLIYPGKYSLNITEKEASFDVQLKINTI